MNRFALFAVVALAAGCAQGAAVGPAAIPPDPADGGAPLHAARVGPNSHHKGILFLPSIEGGIYMYTADIKQKNPPLIGEITDGAQRVLGVWVDSQGTLYAANAGGSGGSFISEYKRGSTEPFKTISQGLGADVNYVAVDATGTLYVDETTGDQYGTVLVYPSGSSSPSKTITLPDNGEGLAAGGMGFDHSGNLIVATFLPESETSHVFKVHPGSWTVTDLDLQGLDGNAIALDAFGNIYDSGFLFDANINVYPKGSKHSTRTIASSGEVFGLTATIHGALYVSSYNPPMIEEYEPGATSPSNSFALACCPVDAAVGTTW
jgi:hypothetical protein